MRVFLCLFIRYLSRIKNHQLELKAPCRTSKPENKSYFLNFLRTSIAIAAAPNSNHVDGSGRGVEPAKVAGAVRASAEKVMRFFMGCSFEFNVIINLCINQAML